MDQLLKEDELVTKWSSILEHADVPAISDSHRKAVTAVLLENQEKNKHLHEAAPTNVTGGVAKWDPVLISMVRRAAPSMIAFDLCGVQPMSAPTGLVFAMRARYTNQNGTEALFDEANTAFSGAGEHSLGGVYSAVRKSNVTSGQTTVTVENPEGIVKDMLVFGNGIADESKVVSVSGTTVTLDKATTATDATANLNFVATAGSGMATATGEGDITAQMAMSIEKVAVEAKTRALKAEYSMELAQDMQAVHGMNAENELTNILTNEVLSEINREVLRNLYQQAKLGALKDTATPGVFDLKADADGRWSAERFKGLHFAIERDANAISFDTKRGKGNVMVCSADVASALSMAGILTTNSLEVSLTSDWTQSTFVGTIGGRVKVFVDPYATQDFYMIGYKGSSPMDSGFFYTPYVPLQLVRGMDPASFQPKLGLKTRHGMVANPFFNGGVRKNGYYRIAEVTNVM